VPVGDGVPVGVEVADDAEVWVPGAEGVVVGVAVALALEPGVAVAAGGAAPPPPVVPPPPPPVVPPPPPVDPPGVVVLVGVAVRVGVPVACGVLARVAVADGLNVGVSVDVTVAVPVGVRHVVGVSVVTGVTEGVSVVGGTRYVPVKVHVTVSPAFTAMLLSMPPAGAVPPESSVGAPPVPVEHAALVSCQFGGTVSLTEYVPSATFMPLVPPSLNENLAGSAVRLGGCTVDVSTVKLNCWFVGSGDGMVTFLTTSVPRPGWASIVSVRSCVAVAPQASATLTAKLEVPASVGMPLITPVAPSRARSGGSVPFASVHAAGGHATSALNVAE
jgi:hypothetical protein